MNSPLATALDSDLDSALRRFEPVSPELLASRALQQRTDTKFLGRESALRQLLPSLTPWYALLGSPATYLTHYFDTPALSMFHDHRRGRRPRQKVRIRHYPDRRVSFLEVKTKHGPARTHKHRIELPFGLSRLREEEDAFLATCTPLPPADLLPTVTTAYRRITLVGKHTQERVTLDHDLVVSAGNLSRSFSGAWIIEVKQARFSLSTPIVRALRDAGVRQARASKYCTGVMALFPAIRSHRLHPCLRALEGVHHG
jgi:hypothetical protein